MLQREIVGDIRRQRRRSGSAGHGLRTHRPSSLIAMAFTIVGVAAVLSGSSSVALGFVTLGCTFRCRSCCNRNRLACFVSAFLVVPGAFVVGLGRLIEAREQSILRQLESVFDDERGVGVVDQIFVRDAVVLDGVIDEAAEKREVAAGANLTENIGLRRGAGEARVDHDRLGVAVALGLDRPLETARMVLGRISAHDQHHVGVLDVDPAVGHCPAPESWSQT